MSGDMSATVNSLYDVAFESGRGRTSEMRRALVSAADDLGRHERAVGALVEALTLIIKENERLRNLMENTASSIQGHYPYQARRLREMLTTELDKEVSRVIAMTAPAE